MINIVLFEPEIPQNTGNIMRTCVATGATLHLIKPLGFRLDEASIKRSGVNYIDKLNYYFYTRYGHKPHTSFDYSDKDKNIYLIFGKESTGIPKEILRPYIDRCARIPMTANVRALNVSNAVAVVIYEALRQRDYEGLLFDEPHKDKNFIMID